MNRIEFKTFFNGWKEVSKEQAKELVLHIIRHASAIKPSEINDYINKNKLRGITVEELLKENK